MLALFAFSLAVNLAALLLVTGPHYLEGGSDEAEYYRRAVRLLQGDGLAGVDRTPGWPFILAAVFRVTGPSVLAGKLVNSCAGAAIPVAVFALACAWLPWRWAWLAGAASGLLPTVFVMSASLWSETVPAFGFLLANVFVAWATGRACGGRPGTLVLRPLDWLAFGAGMALVNLVKPAYLLWLLMLAAAGAWYWRHALVRYAAVVAMTSAGFCAVMAPWWVRNFELTHHFVPFSTSGDASLLESNNPTIAHMQPYLMPWGRRVIWVGPGFFLDDKLASGLVRAEDLVGRDDVEKAQLFRERALAWMAANPREWTILATKKLGYAFGLWPLWQGSYAKLIAGLPFTLLMFASLPGWWWILTRRGSHRLLLLHPLAFVVTTLLFFGSWRYRSAYEPSFVIAALLGLHARSRTTAESSAIDRPSPPR
jgi:hypothetical protein